MSDAASKQETEGIISCPYCHDSVPSLVRIEPGTKLRLQTHAKISPVPDAVCEGCFKMMAKMVSKGAALRAEQASKEQNRLMLWKNRVGLVKQAKQFITQKNFSEAAVSFEKYLRVLEIVYDTKAGELTPDLFKGEAKSQEMTVITSVYWDLMRVYDTNPRYLDRQMKAAEKLAEFARFTPIFPHIMRKAEVQLRSAKHPDAFKKFIKLSNSRRPRCFIATAAFDGQRTETVDALCRFRDERLKRSRLGRSLVVIYYSISPSIAEMLDRHPRLKPAVRAVLNRLAILMSFGTSR
ncbi:MAG TPA: CFI-box-CTERM domain-containing protein [Bdellovibrionales bacterium]|nr:CFI-box-CTERM domain-containing protein [Bdellovibrionales bacterium]